MHFASVEVKVDLIEGSSSEEGSKRLDNEAPRREQFWERIRESPGFGEANIKKKTIRQLELMLEQRFGSELHALLLKHFLIDYEKEYDGKSSEKGLGKSPGDSRNEDEYARLLPKILFKARIRGYSSLVFGVDMASVESLAKLFDGSYDAFELFLDQYIPAAFSATYGEWEGPAEYILTPDASIRKTFDSFGSESINNNSKPSSAIHRANWLWIIANTSLVVPSIAALLGAFLMISSIDKQQERLDQRLTRLLELDESRQRGIASTYNDLIKGYRELLGKPSGK
jgi:hypothetical protein